MRKLAAVLIGLSVAVARGAQGGQEPAGGQAQAIRYGEFMKLGQAERGERFAALDPEGKAAIMRAHAEAWLEQNRSRLTADQVRLVEEAIAFVTPALYRTPSDPELVARRRALQAKLRCRLWRSDVLEVFGPLRAPVPPARWLDDVWAWLQDCVVG